jgi:hypothetical protein
MPAAKTIIIATDVASKVRPLFPRALAQGGMRLKEHKNITEVANGRL